MMCLQGSFTMNGLFMCVCVYLCVDLWQQRAEGNISYHNISKANAYTEKPTTFCFILLKNMRSEGECDIAAVHIPVT